MARYYAIKIPLLLIIIGFYSVSTQRVDFTPHSNEVEVCADHSFKINLSNLSGEVFELFLNVDQPNLIELKSYNFSIRNNTNPITLPFRALAAGHVVISGNASTN